MPTSVRRASKKTAGRRTWSAGTGVRGEPLIEDYGFGAQSS
jgi:hypothetical protein